MPSTQNSQDRLVLGHLYQLLKQQFRGVTIEEGENDAAIVCGKFVKARATLFYFAVHNNT